MFHDFRCFILDLPKRRARKLIKGFVAVTLLSAVLGLSFSISFVFAPDNPKIVYVVICVDSEMWGGHQQYLGSSNPRPTMDMRAYALFPPSTVSKVFDSAFRNSHKDSFGHVFKMTWFAEMDYLMAQSNFIYPPNIPAGVSGYTAIRDILMNNWRTKIRTYGDSIEYHHHFMIYDGTWKGYPSGPDAEYPGYHMYALDHMIIDRNFYPSAWRSGWLIMPPALSTWLEQWIPFDYTPDSGAWYPWHPSGMSRWQTRTVYDVYRSDVNSAFARARDYGSAIYSIFCHDRDDMASKINLLQTYLNAADSDESTYPNVSFKYADAREAMQRALGFTDVAPPAFAISSRDGTYQIESNEPLWKNHPYVALKYSDGTYMHIAATATGTNIWSVMPPTQLITEENVAVRARPTSLPVVSATASSFKPGYEPQKAIDGIESTSNYWDSTPGNCPQWLKLDLGAIKTFGNIRTHFWDGDGRYYKYYIEVSTDGSTWTNVTAEKYVHGVITDTFAYTIAARYIRIRVTDNTGPNKYAHVIEVRIGAASGITASSYNDGHTPDLAIDGIETSSNYWGTNALIPEGQVPQWLKLDLRSPVTISKIATHFYDGDTRTYTYYIEVSTDGLSWATVVPKKTGSGSVTDTFPEVKARFVRITITANTANKAAHIEEIKIYHVTSTPLPSIEKIGVAASDLYGNPGVFVTEPTA